jgi:hypothetical protein
MKYVNSELSVEQIITAFNQGQISLIPPFQRGTVWRLHARKALIRNMVMARPIPAVFLYKQADGIRNVSYILDGKQRLESLLLFIGNKREGMRIEHLRDYFFKKPALADANFSVTIKTGEDEPEVTTDFSRLDERLVRRLREYRLAVIEVDLDAEDSPVSMDEIVDLFVDINVTGVKVNKFDIIRAMMKDKLFKSLFPLVALRQKRKGKAIFYKMVDSEFTAVLKHLNVVSRVSDPSARIDRMWERLTEIALYVQTGKHRQPVDILKGLIRLDNASRTLSKPELVRMRRAFKFLGQAYRSSPALSASKLATDQPQFYTLITTLVGSALLDQYEPQDLIARLTEFSRAVNGQRKLSGRLKKVVQAYREVSAKQTTHPGRRETRQQHLLESIALLSS